MGQETEHRSSHILIRRQSVRSLTSAMEPWFKTAIQLKHILCSARYRNTFYNWTYDFQPAQCRCGYCPFRSFGTFPRYTSCIRSDLRVRRKNVWRQMWRGELHALGEYGLLTLHAQMADEAKCLWIVC